MSINNNNDIVQWSIGFIEQFNKSKDRTLEDHQEMLNDLLRSLKEAKSPWKPLSEAKKDGKILVRRVDRNEGVQFAFSVASAWVIAHRVVGLKSEIDFEYMEIPE